MQRIGRNGASTVYHSGDIVLLKTPGLRRCREKAALTQEELAGLAGLARMTVWRLEAGGRTGRPQSIRLLAEALGVKPEVLYEDNKKPPTPANRSRGLLA